MFQEAIAKLTSEHLRTHIQAYLSDLEISHTGTDKIGLKVPVVSAETLVGGVMSADVDELPIIGVDCVEKQDLPSNESLCYYQYSGAVVGLIGATDEVIADKMIKRYQSAAELFIRDHRFLHLESNDDFMIREFLFVNTSFSGSMEVELEEQRRLWVAGFTTNVLWVTSEDQYRQH